jgi:exodeoxyribonuclease VII small subunit
MAKAKTSPEPSFEQQIERLERIVEALDIGDAPLEELLKLYEEGMSLTQTCRSYLESAQQKILVIDSQGRLPVKTLTNLDEEF